MPWIGVLVGVTLIVVVLIDGFETMILPRRVTRVWRPVRTFYINAWKLWQVCARRMTVVKRREYFLSLFGPLSILTVIALWVTMLILAFALVHWSLETPLVHPEGTDKSSFFTYFYLSGVTFFTLGFGDVTGREMLGRLLTVIEAGMGFGFLAVVIGYVPVLYAAFSRREVPIALLDARAGSPPTAAEMLLRLASTKNLESLSSYLAEWERWSGELLESHISFPSLCYYRSQHDNQSWLAAITAIMDTCALLIAGAAQNCSYQARLTFAMSRHALVDLCMVFNRPPIAPTPDRLPAEMLLKLRHQLEGAGLSFPKEATFEQRLTELRAMYEPFANALSELFLYKLPPILSDKPVIDNWQTSAWMRRVAGIAKLAALDANDEHVE